MIPYFPPRDEPPDPSRPKHQPDDDAAENFEDDEDEVEDRESDEDSDDDEAEPELSWEEQLKAAGAPDDLITLDTFRFAHEAELAKLHLEREGITAFIADAETVAMDWILGSAIGYVKLLVPRGQAIQAVAVLTAKPWLPLDEATRQAVTVLAPTPALPPEMDDDAPEKVTCLACGAVMADNDSSCPACGWSYKDEDDGEQAIQAL